MKASDFKDEFRRRLIERGIGPGMPLHLYAEAVVDLMVEVLSEVVEAATEKASKDDDRPSQALPRE